MELVDLAGWGILLLLWFIIYKIAFFFFQN